MRQMCQLLQETKSGYVAHNAQRCIYINFGRSFQDVEIRSFDNAYCFILVIMPSFISVDYTFCRFPIDLLSRALTMM